MSSASSTTRHYYFITGRLAHSALREIVQELAKLHGFSYTIGVMPITVAALITPRWLLRHWNIPSHATEIIVPGYCEIGLDLLRAQTSVPVMCGPKDLRDLPQIFGEKNILKNDYGDYSIEIIAEINHAPRMAITDFILRAQQLVAEGADVIDIGCDPADRWLQVGDAVIALRDLGIRVSIDTFNPLEAVDACRAGAELVLSVNSSNREMAVDWGSEVVVVPDDVEDLRSFHETVEFLASQRVSMRLDSILEPIGVGVALSLLRYVEVRRRYPELPMMMGVGNVTELTDVDSAGLNTLLLGICEELRIHSVLTTQVINWTRTSVRECDVARRLVTHAVRHRTPPKHLDASLIRLRDPKLKQYSLATLQDLSKAIRDNSFRIYAQNDQIHALSAGLMLSNADPFKLFANILQQPAGRELDAGHAFYLGFEMAKALTALTLGKQYEQDEALNWGDLTRPEQHHRLERRKQH